MMNLPLFPLVWIVPLALLVVYLGSPRFLGTMGSARVRRLLGPALDRKQYTVLNDLVVSTAGGPVHFDHLIVSRFGIWVLSSIHRVGLISGTEVQDRWMQKSAGRVNRFDNPVHDNFLRMQAMEQILELPGSKFHPLVVFSGLRGFKSTVPGHVVLVGDLLKQIRAQRTVLLTDDETNRALRRVQSQQLPPGGFSRARRWNLLRLLLLLGLLAGVYHAYQRPIDTLVGSLKAQVGMVLSAEDTNPEAADKARRTQWESSLICAWSIDTGRCACYEPGGEKAKLDGPRCRQLAEKESILKQ